MRFSHSIVLAAAALLLITATSGAAQSRPNILFVISDDQSYPHASAYGYAAISTPAFDRVAREGVLFTNAFAPSPGCSPTRAALLTGRHIWQIEHAGTHASSFPARYVTFPDLLEQAGYFVGYTGKGWGPGNWQEVRPRNPAGPLYADKKLQPPHQGISSTDYAANFEEFLSRKPEGRPFYFWMGGHEPHRVFEKGVGQRQGRRPEQVTPPSFLPGRPEIRSDILDYVFEIEWFDSHLGRALKTLEEAGELDNTLLIVTSDNGMAFPRAKANLYEYGIHLPLAIRWGANVPGGRTVDDLVALVDLTATILEATGVEHPGVYPLAGRSILDILTSEKEGYVDPSRQWVVSGRERHSSSRYANLGYPSRALRTRQHLYIRNFKPGLWPAGDPQKYDGGELGPMHGGYHDIDASPSLAFLIENRDDPEIGRYFHLAVDKRPAEELFDIKQDPGCINNLADDPRYDGVRRRLGSLLERYLRVTEDPRVLGNGDIIETYKRYSPIRRFPPPEWMKQP